MEQKEPDNSINDDILKCREDILRAGGLDPESGTSPRRKIPSFEEMISGQTKTDETETVEEAIIAEDESEGSGMEVLADTDWRSTCENAESFPPRASGTKRGRSSSGRDTAHREAPAAGDDRPRESGPGRA